MTLVVTTCRNMERGKSCKITKMIRVKGSERRPSIFVFRFNSFQRDSCWADGIVMEIEEGNKKLVAIMSKALVEFYYVCSRHQLNLKETALYEFSLCCGTLIIVNS